MASSAIPSPIDSNRQSPGGALAMDSPATLGGSGVRPSSAARPSMMANLLRPSAMLRPSVVTDVSNVFAEAKLHDARLQLFSSDVVMEGELTKKGEGGMQTWKKRVFVLRGQELSYYTLDNKQRYGALKGTMDVRGASVERVDNLTFNVTLAAGNAVRTLAAPNVQTLMDWMTAIAVAAEAALVDPPSDLAMVDHTRTTHLILVRHGHYATSTVPAEDLNGPLTDLGVQQARATGKFLHEYLAARLVTARFATFPILHSGVRRSVETARYISEAFPAGTIEMRENKLFREAWPGNPLPNANRKMLPREKLDNMASDCARLKVLYRAWFRHLVPDDLLFPERELTEAEAQRFATTVGSRSTQSRLHDRYRVVVCHANIIRWFACKALGVDPDGTWGRMRFNHAGVAIFEVDSVGNVQLAALNETGHLDTTMLSEN